VFKSFAKVLATGLLLAPVSVFAAPITVDFTVTGFSALDATNNFNAPAYNGYAVGTIGTGSFTFDDSIGNFENVDAGVAPFDFSFDWVGTSFTEATAQIWRLEFDGIGNLTGWALGTMGGCPALNCVSSGGTSDFYLTGSGPNNGNAAVHQENVPGWMIGQTTSWSARATSVPEPATLGLLGLGLLGIAAVRRKREVAPPL
jgi:hypothetical protein